MRKKGSHTHFRNSRLWFCAIVVVVILIILMTNWRGIWISRLPKENLLKTTFASIDFLEEECKINVPVAKDDMYDFVAKSVSLINMLCKENNVQWFGSGKATLSLLRTGAIFIKGEGADVDSELEKFEIFLVADRLNKIETVLKYLAKETNQYYSTLKCETNKPFNVPDGCSVISYAHGADTFQLVISAYGIHDAKSNELSIVSDSLAFNYVLPAKRILPVSTGGYYDLAINVPRDSLYFFSHIMPKKGSKAATETRYEYTHICPEENADISFPLVSDESMVREIATCGKALTRKNVQSLHHICRRNNTKEIYRTLRQVLESHNKSGLIYMENFPHVAVIHKGTGTYKLSGSKDKRSWSQFGQDLLVDEILHRKENGFFVEMGGLDGERHSNTLFFELKRHWTGLLIEANPYTFNIMLKRDRKCYMTNACVGTSETPELTFRIAGGITSSIEAMPEIHRNRVFNELNQHNNDEVWTHHGETVLVHCKPFSVLMDKINRTRIDFFSLDVDGSEMIVLKSINWDEVDIDTMIIETEYNRKLIVPFMESKNYKVVKSLKIDDIFQKIRK